MSQTLIDISGLNKVFPTKTGDVHALSDVNLTIGKGEFVSLLGPGLLTRPGVRVGDVLNFRGFLLAKVF